MTELVESPKSKLEGVPRKIELDNDNMFEENGKKYFIRVVKRRRHGNFIEIIKAEINDINYPDIIKNVIIKTSDDIDRIISEIIAHYHIEKKIGYDNYPCRYLNYFISNNAGIIYEDLGIQLDNYSLDSLTLEIKIKMILDFLNQVNFLHINKIYHSDIKPENICIDGEKRLSLIDFGVTYSEYDYDKKHTYITTPISASPEYFLINDMIKKDTFPEKMPTEIFSYSEYYAIAGIIFGILINSINKYFLFCWKNIDSKNYDENDLERIFISFDENYSLLVKNFIKENLENTYPDFLPIINNMFEYNYKDRKPLNEIIEQISKIKI